MPLYHYQCSDCQSKLEIFVKNANLEPKICGTHCPLQRGENDDIRGFGNLQRALSSFNIGNEVIQSDHPNPDQAAKVGLSTYENQGDGTYRKIAGKTGPEIIKK